MQPFIKTTSTVIPLPIKDIDTDMIIPAQYLTQTGMDGYGDHLFERLRQNDSDFPLNKDEYKASNILVASSNFGCGSSREHAVWALKAWGIKVVIASSFADIFFSNSGKNGLVTVILEEEVVEDILAKSQAGKYELEVNLATQTVKTPEGKIHHFKYDPFRRDCILDGLDDLDYILQKSEEINNWDKKRSKEVFVRGL